MDSTPNDQNSKDDALILLLQLAFLRFGIDLGHPCSGTLMGFAENIADGRLHKIECLAAGDQMAIKLQGAVGFPADRASGLRESATRANASPVCLNEGKTWLWMGVTDPGRAGLVSIAVVARMAPVDPRTFTVDAAADRIQAILDFVKANWPST